MKRLRGDGKSGDFAFTVLRQHWREILGPGIKPPKIIGGERDTMGEYNTLPVWQKSKAGREMDRVVMTMPLHAETTSGDEKDIEEVLS
ncbi:MAG: hypothetical protein IPP70_05055 [Elusimicrobia bacterium]|nr:hypothetical protein [Elusimicrobiota bacterium]